MEIDKTIELIKDVFKDNKFVCEKTLREFIRSFIEWETNPSYEKNQIDTAIFEFIYMCESYGLELLRLLPNMVNKDIGWKDFGVPFDKISIVNFIDDRLVDVYRYYESINNGLSIFDDISMSSISYSLMDRIYFAMQHRLNEVLFGDNVK